MGITDIAGYTFQAENLCPGCTINTVSGNSTAAVEFNFDGDAIETWIRTAAQERGIDYDEPRSYDSGDYPKPFFVSAVESDERCGSCGEQLRQ